jgi:outer membrane protein OmpA-like peptidoglycan-associated protein
VHDDDHDDELDDDLEDEDDDDLEDEDEDDLEDEDEDDDFEDEDDLEDDDFEDEDDFEDDDFEDDEVDDLDDEVDDDFEDEEDLEDDEVDDLDDEVDDDFEDDGLEDGGPDDELVVAGAEDPDAARRRSRTRAMAFGGIAVAALVLGWFVVRPAVSDDSSAAPADASASSVEEPESTVEEGAGEEASATTEEASESTVEEASATTVEEVSESTVEEASESTVEEASATTVEEPSTTVEEASATTVEAPSTTAAETSGSVTYDTLPDGSPAPVVAVYDVDRITLTGGVPSEAAKERLEALAVANAKPGQAETVDNLLTINPDVPIGIGVRVVELTSVRFPPRSTEVLPAHARELDRAVAIMEALPNISALVIGHTDQVGDPLRNFAVSEQRADAVVNYMASQGIAPDRLASRAVGEEDLLTLDDDAVARALNRRTEFVFYGLLVE